MEFYLKPCIALRLLGRFNSQRDGILHVFAYANFEKRVGFNSQRDGILPLREVSSKAVGACFNSQRDGILLKLRFKLTVFY